MTIETIEAKTELRELVDTFAILADEKRNADQAPLFAPDATVQVHVGDQLVLDLAGVDDIIASFTAFSGTMKRSFHMNGQQVVEIDGDTARGVAYCQVKIVTEEDSGEVVTDSSVRYDDTYSRIDGRWVIQRRATQFTISDKRPL